MAPFSEKGARARIGFTVAFRKAKENAAGLIENLDLGQFWGEDFLDQIDEDCHHILEEAQRRVAVRLRQSR